jgi:hypothetical protein
MAESTTNSYTNIVAFLLTTYIYYLIFKPRLTYDILTNEKEYPIFLTNSYAFLAAYLIVVMIIQMMVNMNVITSKCGGNSMDNIGVAGLTTFVPWVLIFGILMVVLTIYPGFKSAFSDVIGYYWVANSANKIITDLLISPDVQPKIDTDSALGEEGKKQMQSTADAIIKICGNNSVLINQMTPHNFDDFWKLLTPLMKPQYKPSADGQTNEETKKLQQQLFELVITRDNVGEAIWYVYTGLLVTSVVQLNISTKGCIKSVKTMEETAAKYNLQKEEEEKKAAIGADQIYTL